MRHSILVLLRHAACGTRLLDGVPGYRVSASPNSVRRALPPPPSKRWPPSEGCINLQLMNDPTWYERGNGPPRQDGGLSMPRQHQEGNSMKQIAVSPSHSVFPFSFLSSSSVSVWSHSSCRAPSLVLEWGVQIVGTLAALFVSPPSIDTKRAPRKAPQPVYRADGAPTSPSTGPSATPE